MSSDPVHPERGLTLPGGVTEADLLDWVEGCLPPTRAHAVEAAIRADARLADRLRDMRADRTALLAMKDVAAPAGLIDAVEQAVERRMLVGLASGEPLSDRPPVSVVQGPSRRLLFRGDAVGRHLALAAGLLLLVGGTSVVGVLAMHMARSSTYTPIAAGPAKANPVPELAVNDATSPALPEQSTAIAANTAAPDDFGPPEALAEDSPSEPGMTLARAAELAREGRLLIRVKTRDLDRSLLRLGRMTREPRTGWSLGEDAPGTLIAGLQAEPPRRVDPTIEPVLVAWSDLPSISLPMSPFPPIVLPRVEEERVIPTVFLARVRADEDTLRGILAAMDATLIQTAVFEESPVSIETPGLPLEPHAVLWWAQDPSGWTAWAQVPVVVGAGH